MAKKLRNFSLSDEIYLFMSAEM